MNKFPKKILLLSPVPPCSNYSGGLVLEQLSRFLPKGSLVCFALMDPKLEPQIAPDLQWIPIEYASKPADGWPKLPYQIGTLLSLFGEAYYATIVTKVLIDKIVQFGKKHRIDTIWITLQGQTSIRLAEPVAKALNVPLLSEVWDPPQWWLKENNIDAFWTKMILKRFAKTLKFSESCAVASWKMAKQYHDDYGANTIPFLPSLPANWAYPPAHQIHSRSEVIIGMVGQLYSASEWDSFLAALDELHWQINKRKIKIRLLGNYVVLSSYKQMNVEYLGYQSQKDTLKLMNESDILYCPYYFDPRYDKVSKLSFPSKLTTYLASGRPVFFHGPSDSSPGVFLKENQAALSCSTLEPKEIAKILAHLVKNPKLYAKLAQNGRKAFDRYLTFESLHHNFAKFLDVNERELSDL